jgi:transketolase
VETTTGPLGQGVGNAVGMAMAARRERGLYDPDAAPGESPFDHRIYAICSDGDLEEGVSGEASSIAGHQQLGNLTMIYDDNRISIEGNTDIAFTEDVGKRYEAYGWHVQVVDWTKDGDRTDAKNYHEDVPELWAALEAAEAETDRPSLIILRTIIACPAPHAHNTGAAHGSALGDDEVAATKKILGFDPDKTFEVSDEVLDHTRGLVDRGKVAEAEWEEQFAAWREADPDRSALFDRLATRTLPDGWADALPSFRRTRRAWPPARPPALSSRRSPRCSRSCGAAPPTSPSPTTPPPRASRASPRTSGRRPSGAATSTAACCTSASASTPWARS